MAVSTTRLVILGGVLIFQPVHGYLLRRELLSWHPEHWANLKQGSIYNALRVLEREGLLEELRGDESAGGRAAAKTQYRLTAEGEAEFLRLLREALRTVLPLGADAVAAGWNFAWALPRTEVVMLFEERLAKIDEHLLSLSATAEAAAASSSVPPHVPELSRLLSARLEGERLWVERLLPRLRAGDYRFSDE